MPFINPTKPMPDRQSASISDADAHTQGSEAADAESQRIAQWESQKFAGNPRHQSARDASFGFPAKGVKR